MYAFLHFIPFSQFVDITYFEIADACVGDDTVHVDTNRTVAWGIEGKAWSQVIKFEDPLNIETSIYRAGGTDSFGYEPDTTSASYEIQLSKPLTDPGEYGLNEWVTIYPLPFISIKTFNDAADNKFNVIVCEQ